MLLINSDYYSGAKKNKLTRKCESLVRKLS